MDKDFKTLFNETLHNYGVSLAKLAETTGIPERYLEAMHSGNEELLPPDPYVRGYLIKITAVTGGNLDELWSAYKLCSAQKISGPSDQLPRNRFSLQKISRGKVALVGSILILALYGILRLDVILGNPELVLTSPEDTLVLTKTGTVPLRGKINNRDKLTINGENVIVDEDGSFSADWPLNPGTNEIEIKAKRFLGKETIIKRKVIYTPAIGNGTTTNESNGSLLLQ